MNTDGLPRKAALGIFFGQWAYWCTLAVAAWSYRYIPQGSIRTTLILTPILPAILIAAIAYWMYRACDEFIRLRILKCLVVTALAVAFGTLAYFVLELLGFPLMIYVIVRSR